MLGRVLNNTFSFKMPSFTLYNDGIGVNSYSLRVSNMSFDNLKNNITYSMIWGANVTAAAAYDFAGLVSNDEKTHYRISSNRFGTYEPIVHFNKEWVIGLLNESNCNVSYDQLRQNEYYDLSSTGIYRKENYFKGYVLDVNLDRGRFEPIQQQVEDCLKHLVNSASVIWQDQVASAIKSNNDISAAQMEQVKSYLYTGLGLFALGVAGGIAVNQWKKSRNRISGTSLHAQDRLSKISYKDEINDELTCPISQDIMDDPVITNDGKTYDRSQIEEWCKRGTGMSPLIPNIKILWYQSNYEVREKIEKFVSDLESQRAVNNPVQKRRI